VFTIAIGEGFYLKKQTINKKILIDCIFFGIIVLLLAFLLNAFPGYVIIDDQYHITIDNQFHIVGLYIITASIALFSVYVSIMNYLSPNQTKVEFIQKQLDCYYIPLRKQLLSKNTQEVDLEYFIDHCYLLAIHLTKKDMECFFDKIKNPEKHRVLDSCSNKTKSAILHKVNLDIGVLEDKLKKEFD